MHVSLPKLPALALMPLACVDGPFTCHISVSILSQVHKFVSTYICGENALLFFLSIFSMAEHASTCCLCTGMKQFCGHSCRMRAQMSILLLL